MGAAISIFVLLSLSTLIVRLAAVAMRLTGLDESTARFQSLSAFTGTGFTISEAERIVNYPVRRRIVTLLMIIGNLGVVGVSPAPGIQHEGAASWRSGRMQGSAGKGSGLAPSSHPSVRVLVMIAAMASMAIIS